MTRKQELRFQASAYLQRLIGRELISSAELAVTELVKNAYDAGARSVEITIRPPSIKEPGEITVVDDGEGMTLAGFERLFMVAGYSERPSQINESPRVPTGEKGIGRFAADKLGQSLSILTKSLNSAKALEVEIDWNLFDNRKKKFNDISVPFSHRPPTAIATPMGTLLRITRLRDRWDPSQLVRLKRSLAELLDPFRAPTDFRLNLQVPGSSSLSGEVVPQQVTGYDIGLNLKVLKSGAIKRFLQGNVVKEVKEETKTSAKTEPIGGLQAKFLYFLERPKKEDTNRLQGGVRLYRDGFRVEPFGGTKADWLGIKEKREKRAGHAHIVPSRLFGFVSISRKQQPDLRHTTSREALLEGDAVESMITLLREQLQYLEYNIRTEVTEPRWKESKSRRAAELQRLRLQTLSIMSAGLAHELRQPMQAIRTEADNISERLKQLKVDDADILESQKSIDDSIERIDQNIKNVAAISTGSLEVAETVDLSSFIRSQGEYLRPSCAMHSIELDLQLPASQPASINPITVLTVLSNLVQNAIDELRQAPAGDPRRIVVTLSKSAKTNILEVSDTGRGIDEDVEPKLFKKFATKKTGGWGVGLYNCNLHVQSHRGKLTYRTRRNVGTTFRMELPDSAKEDVNGSHTAR